MDLITGNINKAFFSLVKAGLWNNKPELDIFKNKINWSEIYKESQKQALLGIVLDGIDLLPESLRPPRDLYLKWCADVLQIEDNNIKLDIEVSKLFKFLKENGIEPVLLKGQGISKYYPNPEHRTSGDIDIYIGEKNYDKVSELLSIEGKALEKWSPKHIMFSWHDEIVENHRILATLISPKAQRNFNKIIDSWHNTDFSNKCKIGDQDIIMPPLEFDAVYLLLHSVNHLMGYGIGLRQICDWAVFLHVNHKKLNLDLVKKYIKDLGMDNAFRIFGALAVKYLGMPQEDLILTYDKTDEEESKILLNDILRNGNFGFSSDRIKKFSKATFFKRLLFFKDRLKRVKKLHKIAPDEARWLPFFLLRNFIIQKVLR